MRKLIRNLILFLLPVLLFLFIFSSDKRLKYQELKNDCVDRGIWIYDRINSNEKPIDIAFFGSSHTLNGLNDKFIEDSLITCRLSVVNFGYCRLGNNLVYVLINELVKRRKVKAIILEVREDENLFSHPIYPYIADTKDVLLSYPLYNKDQLKDIFINISYKTEILQKSLFNHDSISKVRMENFGFLFSNDTVSSSELDAIKIKRNHSIQSQSKALRELQMKYPRKYIEKIHTICKINHIELIFLYLPAYGSPYVRPMEFEFYKKYGEVFIPPSEILENKFNWTDVNHLNHAGANKLSAWLVGKINNIPLYKISCK